MRALAILIVLLPAMARADGVIAVRTLPAHSVLAAADVALAVKGTRGSAEQIAEVEGLEIRTAVYQGQPILLSNLVQAAEVERNQLVTILYRGGTVTISAEGRALDRGAVGERIRVMNTGSRATVRGEVAPGGKVRVSLEN